jgi:hypothetical protein
MIRASRPEARKVWKEGVSVPLYQALGRVPVGSPVLGRM